MTGIQIMEFLKIEFRGIIEAQLEVTSLQQYILNKHASITDCRCVSSDHRSKAVFVRNISKRVEQVVHESFRITLDKLYHGRRENYDSNCGRQLFRDSFPTNFS